MLHQVLQELRAYQGTMSLDDLALRLEMEPGAVKGLVEFWVAKGRLRLVGSETGDGCAAACSLGNCPGAAQCPFVAKIPVSFEFRRDQ